MAARLDAVYNEYTVSLSKLATFSSGISGAPNVQKAMAELVLLRIFYRLEAFLAEATARICCGAPYLDGSLPALLLQSTSRNSAVANMRCHGRFKANGMPKTIDLKWTIDADILNNVKFLVAQPDNFTSVIANHGPEMDRLRRMRNHIAHGNRDTSKKYRPVVTYHYGVALPHITPGVLLLSPRFTPILLTQAFVFARVFARDLVKA